MTSTGLEGLESSAHHRRALERLVDSLARDPANLALLLGGSLAHGYARPDSDIDVLQVVGREQMERLRGEGRLTWSDPSLCEWEGGYVDAKYVDTDLLEDVAERGSEPARYAYQDARILFSRIDGLDDILARVVRYPIEGRDDRVARFAAQLLAWRWYHSESIRQESPYLGALARQKVVLFACRIVLACNERLYPFHKWLLRETERAPERPLTLLEDIDLLLRHPSQPRVERLIDEVFACYGIDEAATNRTWPSLFMQDVELAWTGGHSPIDDL
jgi:hypothetical protein